MKTKQNAASRV